MNPKPRCCLLLTIQRLTPTCGRHCRATVWVLPAMVALAALALLSEARAQSPASSKPMLAEASVEMEKWQPEWEKIEISESARQRAATLSLYYKARRLEREVDDELALKTYQEIMRLEPANVRLAERISRLLVNLEKPNDAAAVLDKCLADNPQSAAAYIAVSKYCLRYHNNSDAVKAKGMQHATQALEKFPQDARVYVHLISAYFKLEPKEGGQAKEKSREVLEKALQSNATDPRFWLTLSSSAQDLYPLEDKENRPAHLEKVLQFIHKAQQTGKDDPEIAEAVADAFASIGTEVQQLSLLQKALPIYEQIVAKHPDRLDVRHKLARALKQAGAGEKAEKIYEELLQINSMDLSARRELLKMLQSRKDTKGAVFHRLELLKWEGGSPDDWLAAVADLLDLDQTDEALQVLKRACAAHPASARLSYRQAQVLYSRQSLKESLAAFGEAKNRAEKYKDEKRFKANAELLQNGQFWHDWATAAHSAKESDLAAECYRKAIDLAPKDKPEAAAASYNGLGYMWLELDQKIDEAGELIRVANQLKPDEPAFIDSMGWFHFKKQNFAEAQKEFERALGLLKTPDPEILDHLAQVQWHSDAKPAAIASLEKAVALPGCPDAVKLRLEEYKAAQAKPEAQSTAPSKT